MREASAAENAARGMSGAEREAQERACCLSHGHGAREVRASAPAPAQPRSGGASASGLPPAPPPSQGTLSQSACSPPRGTE